MNQYSEEQTRQLRAINRMRAACHDEYDALLQFIRQLEIDHTESLIYANDKTTSDFQSRILELRDLLDVLSDPESAANDGEN
ncbi:hypothetical protein [Bowmanella sp. JS7-9]|uniref:Coil containing protein n=1 Tax=Pseudobowmanella zhangzhouensis TaxID=1537679 RepID=A0ABW1XML5_9ALTE|nr:hypothetical protein [Bowmanella sp. JS7-9]TBX21918.1 hypothetical protein TK45_10545 [Bowmanella sp. JS7-9]